MAGGSMALAQKTHADWEMESAIKFYSKMPPAKIIELNNQVNKFLISNNLQIKPGSHADLGVVDNKFILNVKEVQKELGFKEQDGKWGNNTQKAYDSYNPRKKEELIEMARARVAETLEGLPTRIDIEKKFSPDAKPVKIEQWVSGYSLTIGGMTFLTDIITDKPPDSMSNKEKVKAFINAINEDRIIFSDGRPLTELDKARLRKALSGEGEELENSRQVYSKKQA